MSLATTRVATGVTLVRVPNPGPKTLTGTNTYVIGSKSLYLLDPGPDIPEHLEELALWLLERGPVTGILLSHGHPDHANGAERLSLRLGVPVLMDSAIDPQHLRGLTHAEIIKPGVTLNLDGGYTLVPVHTPGHSPDHLSFLFQPVGILFSGDTILGSGTTLIARPEGDMGAYMKTLERIQNIRPSLIAPGHGPIIFDPETTIERYIRHRQEREQQLMAQLEVRPATIENLVDHVYGNVDTEIRSLAMLSVEAQLDKLNAEGRVRLSTDGYWTSASAYPSSPGITNS